MKPHLITILFLAFTALAFGQTQQTPTVAAASPTPTKSAENDDQPIKVNTLLLNIPVIATDRNGGYISGLKKDDFIILEDGEKQPIAFFADDRTPMHVAILIDHTSLISSTRAELKSAARNFVKDFRPEDQGMIATFDKKTHILSEFTSDQTQLLKAIDKAQVTTNFDFELADAINQLVTKYFASIKGRKAIIVLTEGWYWMESSNKKLLSTLAASDVIVYPIFFYIPTMTRKDQAELLNSLATITGGRFYALDLRYYRKDFFEKTFQAIAGELKTQYSIGFYPQDFDDGKDHKISVGVNSKDIVIRTKQRIKPKPAQ